MTTDRLGEAHNASRTRLVAPVTPPTIPWNGVLDLISNTTFTNDSYRCCWWIVHAVSRRATASR